MATNSPGKGKEIIGFAAPSETVAYVIARAERLDQSKAWVMNRILEYWIAQGAPAMSEADSALPEFTYENFLKTSGGYGAELDLPKRQSQKKKKFG